MKGYRLQYRNFRARKNISLRINWKVIILGLFQAVITTEFWKSTLHDWVTNLNSLRARFFNQSKEKSFLNVTCLQAVCHSYTRLHVFLFDWLMQFSAFRLQSLMSTISILSTMFSTFLDIYTKVSEQMTDTRSIFRETVPKFPTKNNAVFCWVPGVWLGAVAPR